MKAKVKGQGLKSSGQGHGLETGCHGGAEFAGPENVGPQKNNDWKLQHLENGGPNRSPGICKTWKMKDQIAGAGKCRTWKMTDFT